MLEIVDGQTLAERVARGPLSIADVLIIGAQIANALEAAHEQGIIHRDLKPANIKVTPTGTVKVLDFGLAKAIDRDRTADAVTSMVTRPGTILGTPAYMSPEQVRGEEVDKRTDVWALGCVLFELLTNRRAFGGGTASDCVAAVLEREPDWSALPPATPSSIRALLRRCLQKDRAKRLRDIGDARFALEDASSTPEHAASAQPGKRPWIACSLCSGRQQRRSRHSRSLRCGICARRRHPRCPKPASTSSRPPPIDRGRLRSRPTAGRSSSWPLVMVVPVVAAIAGDDDRAAAGGHRGRGVSILVARQPLGGILRRQQAEAD